MTLDQLVVSLVLDTAGFTKGQKEAVSSVEKTKVEVVKHGAAIEKAIGKASDSFEAMAGKALTVFAIFAGAKSVEEFTRKITVLDVAVGRLSASMGQSPEDVSAIGKAVERMGGSADTAMAGLRGLSDAFEQFRTTGTSAIMEPLARLQGLSGKAIKFGSDVKANFLSISDALKAEADKGAQGKTMASFLGRQILGSDDLANFAMQGGAAVQAGMAQSVRHGVISDKDFEAAKNLQAAFVGVGQTIVGIGQQIETALTPYITGLLKQLDDWLLKNKDGLVAQVQKAVEDFGKAVATHQKEITAFGDQLVAIMTAAGSLATALSSEGPLGAALAGLGALALAQVTGPLATLARTMVALGLLNPAVLATAGVGYILASGDPNKSVLAGGHPDTAPQDNDLGLPGVGDRTSDTTSAKSRASGAWDWIKSKLGIGGTSRVEDAAVETAEGVKALVKQGERAQGGGDGMQGVTASSGGLGGSGRHFGGGSSAGASLGDRGHGGHGFGHGEGPSDPNLPTGNVPGASGFGAINAYYKGALDKNNQNGLGPKAQYDYLRSIGASENEALLLTGAAANESNFNPGAIHDHGTGYGMFGHNTGRLDLRGKGWQEQDKLALAEMRRMFGDRVTKARSPEEVADYEMHYERPQGYHKNSPRSGHNYMGRLNTIRRFGALAGHGGAGTPAPSSAAQSDADKFKARQRALSGAKTSFLDGLNRQAPAHVAMLAAGAQAAAHAAHSTTTHHNDNSSETHIGTINVQTAATDANGIAGDMGPALKRGQRAAKANYGLA